MNTKIFHFLLKNLQQAFSLKKYNGLPDKITADTNIVQLPWTPARYRKFCAAVSEELFVSTLPADYTLGSITDYLDTQYSRRFFGQVWRPRTEDYVYTGFSLVDEICSHNPQSVLDVGCGYHPFRGLIPNLVGIDPYNSAADYMVDILEYRVEPESHDHIIALGSINFNSKADVEKRFAHCVELLAPGGRMYFRVNPGIPHANNPYVEIFPWSFEVINEFCQRYRLKLETFKRDTNDRLFFICTKSKS